MKKKIAAVLLAAAMMAAPVSGNIISVVNAHAAGIADTQDSEDFLLDCGDRAGYDYLGTCARGDKMQMLYDDMYDAYIGLWNDETRAITREWDYGYLFYADLDMYGLSFDEATIVYYTFKNDQPLYYFSDLSTASDGVYLFMTADDDFKYGVRRSEAQKNITDYILKLAEEASAGETDYDKISILEDALVRDLDYAFDQYGNSSKEVWAHNITGAAEKGLGVCEAYARTFQAVLNYLDIDNYFIAGLGQGGGHAWNMAMLDDGKYYYFDSTWDDQTGDRRFFAKGSRTMSADHELYTPGDDPNTFMMSVPKASETDYDPANSDPSTYELGDVNGDGKVNSGDIVSAAAQIKGLKSLNRAQRQRADVNMDGKVNSADIIRIAAKIKGLVKF